MYYLFSAATVLIAAKLRTDMFNSQDINQTWDEVMKVLQAHEHVSQSARRCVAALQILSSKILQGTPPMDAPIAFNTSLPPMQSTGPHADRMSLPIAQGQAMPQFPELDIRELTFTVDDFSWLNDMNAWNVLNDT